MPRGFTEEERDALRTRLIEEGRRLFSSYGFTKTTVRDLTSAVGIAQGSFYGFFDSKEDLYFEILDVEGQRLRKQLCPDVKAVTTGEPRRALKELLLHAFRLVEANPLLQQLFTEQNTYTALTSRLPESQLRQHIAKDLAEVMPVIRHWQEKGVIRDAAPEVIVGLLFSLFFLWMHQRELEWVGQGTFEFLVDLIVEGVVNDEKHSP